MSASSLMPPGSSAGSGVGGPSLASVASLQSAHQTMESAIVEMMNTIVDAQMEKANIRRRREEQQERRRKEELASQQQAAAMAQAAQSAGNAMRSGHARAPSTSAATVTQDVASLASDTASSPSSSSSQQFSSFVSHFHLLTHLLLQLPATSLEHLIHFLQPTHIEQAPAENGDEHDGGTHSQHGSGGMSYCFPLLDSHTQISLIELLIKTYLQLVYLREKTERAQQEEEEYWQRQQLRRDAGLHSKLQGEGEINPGEQVGAAASSSSHGSSANVARSSPSASSLCQLRLLHVLRAYSGHYRLSYVIHRCVDYQNWLACAVSMESCMASSRTSDEESPIRGRPPTSGLLIASGAVADINLMYAADAMECRLKHMEQRVATWADWKRKRAADPLDASTCPATAKTGVAMLLPNAFPLPAEVWLSFDEYAQQTAHLFMQLVSTHLIKIRTVSEQARLVALLMRGWREWDLPSLVLESAFLSNLVDIADALSMLAFQKQAASPQVVRTQSGSAPTASMVVNPHNFSTNSDPEELHAHAHAAHHSMHTDGSILQPAAAAADGGVTSSTAASAAPIFSAKLYLALTHYRLNQVYRANRPSTSTYAGTSNSSSMLPLGATSSKGSESSSRQPPSVNQLHRLWSEILANLNRDLDGAAAGASGALSAASTNANDYIIFKGLSASASGAARTASRPKDLPSGRYAGAPESDRSVVLFTCGHCYPHKEFFSSALPELFTQLATFSPPIPITAKFLQVEYATLQEEEKDDDDDPDEAAASRRRVVSLACPSCVGSTLVQMQQRQQTMQKAAHLSQQQAWRPPHHSLLTPAAPSGLAASLAGSSSSRSLTPTAMSLGVTGAPVAAGTTFSFIQRSNAASSSHGLKQPAVGLRDQLSDADFEL